MLLYLDFIKFVNCRSLAVTCHSTITLTSWDRQTGRNKERERDRNIQRDRPDVSRSRGQTIVVSTPSAVPLSYRDIPHTLQVLRRRASQHRQHHCQPRRQLTLMNLWQTVTAHRFSYNVTRYVTHTHTSTCTQLAILTAILMSRG